MVFTADFTDEGVRRWSRTGEGVSATLDQSYRPTIYATTEGDSKKLQHRLDLRHDVVATATEQWQTGFREQAESVLRIDLASIDRVRPVATQIRSAALPGANRCFNVDLSPQFRYCLETGTDPTPAHPLRTCSITAAETELSQPPISELTVDGTTLRGDPASLIARLADRLGEIDPDVLVCSTAEIVPALFELAAEAGVEFSLGRGAGYQQLASASTFESYGRVGHSPARYTVPGRVIIDRSNTFFYDEANLDGCLDLVERSSKPLEELSWASIGNVLTAIQIQEATRRGVLVPWNSWRHEFFKPMATLHEADRGGYTFAPQVGIHENVHELDFSSLYPNIIVTRNVSPETVRCGCHPGRSDVPGLGYSICEERGYLPDVLEPLIADRDAIKAELSECEDPERRTVLEGQSAAIKWILVSCFGYQGFSNAKFGRIECHETINAYAREILLDAKATLEANGWEVLHGIVDSLWVTPTDGGTGGWGDGGRGDEGRGGGDQTPLREIAAQVTDEVGIRLEYEAAYDWIAFVPRRDADRGALTKYFGRSTDDEYKYRGIECRQRSTPAFIADAQRALIECFDSHRDPAVVCDRLAGFRSQLYQGRVDPSALVSTVRVSKDRTEYSQRTLTVAALERAADRGLSRSPGQSVRYVVVDDTKPSRDRVRLALEAPTTYDAAYYDTELLRAATSVLSPVGWDEARIREYLSGIQDLSLDTFG